MNTVDSWIDPEWISELVDRLGQPPGTAERSEEEKDGGSSPAGKGAAEEPQLSEAPVADLSRTEGRKLRSAVELVANAGPVPEAMPEQSGVVLSPEGVESLARFASRTPVATPERRRAGDPILEARAKVRMRLAELRFRRSTEDGAADPEASPFSSAE